MLERMWYNRTLSASGENSEWSRHSGSHTVALASDKTELSHCASLRHAPGHLGMPKLAHGCLELFFS